MSLDDLLWRRLHFQNVIMKCLSIESVEYCYFLPIVSQLADYWGDIKMACLCKIMSRQVKQHLTHAIHLHLFLSTLFRDPLLYGSQKGKQLKDSLRDLPDDRNLLFDSRLQNILKSRKDFHLKEAFDSGSSYFLYSTSCYLKPSQSRSSSSSGARMGQRSRREKCIGAQRDLEQIPSFLLVDKAKVRSGTLQIENIYQHRRSFPFKVQSKNFFNKNFAFADGPPSTTVPLRGGSLEGQLLHQNNQSYPRCAPWVLSYQRPLLEGSRSNQVRSEGRKKEKKFLLGNFHSREKNVFSVLHNIDNSFFQLLEDTNKKGSEGRHLNVNFIDEAYSPVFPFTGSSSFSCLPSVQKTLCEAQDSTQDFIWNIRPPQITVGFFRHLESISQKRINKISFRPLVQVSGKDIYFLFLQILRDRKIWKSEQWYPFVSTLSLNSKLFSYKVPSSFDSSYLLEIFLFYGFHKKKYKDLRRMESKLSQSFIKLSQSEKQFSQLITTLINK